MRSRNILFTLFPIGYWALIAAGAILHFLPSTYRLGNVLLNSGAFLISFKAAVIIHEAGHLAAAKAVGGTPKRVVLGRGHELYKTKFLTVIIVINSEFIGGHTYAYFGNESLIRLRYAVYLLGGVLFNVACALIMYIFFETSLLDQQGQVILAIPFTVFLANALMIINLIPFYTNINGIRVPTDGLSLLTLPFKKLSELKTPGIDLIFDAYEHIEKKDYLSALSALNENSARNPGSKSILITYSFLSLKMGHPEKSLSESLRLLDHINDKKVKRYEGLIYNQIAWTSLVLNNLDLADHYSALALKKAPKEKTFRGTRGAVLVEKGFVVEGMNLLFQGMDFNYVNSETLCCAIYLMLAYYKKGNGIECLRYLQFIKDNENKLDVDEKILFIRNLAHVQPTGIYLPALTQKNVN